MIIEEELKNVSITLAQAIALYKVYQRTALYFRPEKGGKPGMPSSTPLYNGQEQLPFAEFMQSIGMGPDCIMVPWLGMWLGIEPDGYTHS